MGPAEPDFILSVKAPVKLVPPKISALLHILTRIPTFIKVLGSDSTMDSLFMCSRVSYRGETVEYSTPDEKNFVTISYKKYIYIYWLRNRGHVPVISILRCKNLAITTLKTGRFLNPRNCQLPQCFDFSINLYIVSSVKLYKNLFKHTAPNYIEPLWGYTSSIIIQSDVTILFQSLEKLCNIGLTSLPFI